MRHSLLLHITSPLTRVPLYTPVQLANDKPSVDAFAACWWREHCFWTPLSWLDWSLFSCRTSSVTWVNNKQWVICTVALSSEQQAEIRLSGPTFVYSCGQLLPAWCAHRGLRLLCIFHICACLSVRLLTVLLLCRITNYIMYVVAKLGHRKNGRVHACL